MGSDGSPHEETLDYDPESGTYRTRFDAAATAPSMAVVAVVESLTGSESTALEPLYERVDPAALDQLLTPSPDGRYDGDRTVAFVYEGYELEVSSYGTVTARPLDGDDEAGGTD